MEGNIWFRPGKIQSENAVKIVKIAGIANKRTTRRGKAHKLAEYKVYEDETMVLKGLNP